MMTLPSRRAFLGGAASVVALPWLESRAPAAAPPVPRLVAFFVPCGIWMPTWTPAATGPDWEPTPTLRPLVPWKRKLSLLSGLDNLPAREPQGKGDHACGTAGFLTCRLAKKLPNGGYRVGVSMDQVAARAIGASTRVPSLQIGVKSDSTVCDPGYSCAYINNVSWASDTQPLPKTTRPDLVFDQMFEGREPGASARARARRRALRTSVLDYVLAESRSLSGRLPADDQRKLDEYMTGVRDVERRVQAVPVAGRGCADAARPGDPGDVPARIRVMLDLIVLAFRCDATRVVTFMMGNGFEGGLDFPFLGIGTNHHPISHHQNRPENIERLKKIDVWEVEQLAYLLERLDGVREGERSLLDASVVFFSSEIEDGNSHGHRNLPIVVAGTAGGRLRTGEHRRYDGKPIANLFITLLGAVGAPVATFGEDGTGALPDLVSAA
jgi:hypothetical protein